MHRHAFVALSIATIVAGGSPTQGAGRSSTPRRPASLPALVPAAVARPAPPGTPPDLFARQPLRFVKNEGQVAESVRFYEQGHGHATYFADDGVYLSLVAVKPPGTRPDDRPAPPEVTRRSLVKLALVGAQTRPTVIAEEPLPGKFHYIVGDDPARWRTNVPTYGALRYQNVYDGVDVRYYGNSRQLEYDVVVRPGADLERVRFSYEGIEGLEVLEDGSLELALAEGKIVQKRPFVYQEIDGRKVEVAGRFKIIQSEPGTYTCGFEVDGYDKARDLVIDPTLDYSFYLGGSLDDTALAVAADGDGSVYVTGETWSADFPTLNAYQPLAAYLPDVFVTKIDASGSLVYSTYLSHGIGYGIAVDAAHNAYVTGSTAAGYFNTSFPAINPLHPGMQLGAFVAKLNDSGIPVFATTIGTDAADKGRGIAVDGAGNMYVTGETQSESFPSAGGFQSQIRGAPACGTGVYPYVPCPYDAFLTKIAANFTLVYSSYLGGSDRDYGNAIAVDGAGFAYITGETCSPDFYTTFLPQPANQSYCNAFVTKVDSAGWRLSYSTYLGGSWNDVGRGIAVDGAGSAYVTGFTGSPDFPTTPKAARRVFQGLHEAFVTKLNAAGNAFLYSTFLGGAGDDMADAIAVDRGGNAFIAGATSSADFPTKDPFQPVLGSASYDAFVTELDAWGTLRFSTFLGGNAMDSGWGIAEDGAGHVCVAGTTQSTDFPVSNHSGPSHGGWDGFVVRMAFGAFQALSFTAEDGFTDGLSPAVGLEGAVFTYKVVYTDPNNSPPVSVSVCIDDTCHAMSVDGAAAPGLRDGYFGNGEQYAFATTLPLGTHEYRVEVLAGTDILTLPAAGSITGPVVVSPPVISYSAPLGTQGVPYAATPTLTGATAPYNWSATPLPAGFTIDPATGVISAPSPVEGRYYMTVSVTDANGLTASKEIFIGIRAYDTPPPAQTFDVIDIGTLGGSESVAIAMNGSGQVTGYSYTAAGARHGFIFSNGVIQDIGTLPGGTYSLPAAINDAGQVTGDADTASGIVHAFLYSNGVMTDLGALGASGESHAKGINGAGHVVGWATNGPNGNRHAFLYSNGTMTDLGTLGGPESSAAAVNGSDQVAGRAYPAGGTRFHAFLHNGVMNDLDGQPDRESDAYLINGSGQVAGFVRAPGSYGHAFLYSSSGGLKDIGTLGGYESVATAMNDSGQVAGYSQTGTGVTRPFLYSNGVMKDLGTLGGLGAGLTALNNAGVVVGRSDTADNAPRAFVYSDGTIKLIAPSSPNWWYLSSAVAINDNGQIAGTGVVKVVYQQHAFLAVPSAQSLQLSPNVARQGQQSLSVSITSRSTHFVQGTTTASFGAGVTVSSLTVVSPTSATAVLDVDSAATVGTRNVTLTTGAEVVSQASGFLVTAAVPALTLVTPNYGLRGQQTLSVEITGQSTHFLQGTTTASFGAGITTSSLTVHSPTSATAVLNIDLDAAAGARNVSVTTNAETVVLADGFSVSDTLPVNLAASKAVLDPNTQTWAGAATFNDGAVARFRLTATNTAQPGSALLGSTTGPITMTDTLPAGLTFIEERVALGSAPRCSAAGQVVTCVDPGPLAPGQAVSFTLDTRVATGGLPGPPRQLANATSVATVNDTNPADNASAPVSLTVLLPPVSDFDGDRKADVAVYRPGQGTWFWLRSSTHNADYQFRGWGLLAHNDTPVVGDFDGDGVIDPTVYRPGTGTWFILESHANLTTWQWFGWGVATDTPVPADYDGDGRTDAAVYRPSTGEWFVRPSSGVPGWQTVYGQTGDLPVPGDYDGDGRADVAVYRPATGTWFVLTSGSEFSKAWSRGWGIQAQGDEPVPGDYDGDGKTDVAVYRRPTGTWFVLKSSTANTASAWWGWGNGTDQVMPGDYDGDGTTDAAVYRPATGEWFVRPGNGAAPWSVVFGRAGDVPLQRIR